MDEPCSDFLYYRGGECQKMISLEGDLSAWSSATGDGMWGVTP